MSDLDHHGQSVAAWTTVAILIVASVIMGAAFFIPSVALFVVGAVVFVIGLVVGKVLAMAGYGVRPPTPREPVNLD